MLPKRYFLARCSAPSFPRKSAFSCWFWQRFTSSLQRCASSTPQFLIRKNQNKSPVFKEWSESNSWITRLYLGGAGPQSLLCVLDAIWVRGGGYIYVWVYLERKGFSAVSTHFLHTTRLRELSTCPAEPTVRALQHLEWSKNTVAAVLGSLIFRDCVVCGFTRFTSEPQSKYKKVVPWMGSWKILFWKQKINMQRVFKKKNPAHFSRHRWS